MSCGIVIGVGPGIGTAVVRRMLAEGLDVGLVSRNGDAMERLRRQHADSGRTLSAHPADAADPGALTAALEQAVDRLGPPDLIVYNAVAWPPGDLLEVPPAALADSLAVNAVGPVTAAQACAPHLREGSSLLITGGGIVFAPAAGAAALSLGKTASRLVTSLLAETLAPRGVHVATVLIAGQVAAGGRFDPDLIAGELWRLHTQPRAEWQHETTWR